MLNNSCRPKLVNQPEWLYKLGSFFNKFLVGWHLFLADVLLTM